MSKEKLPWSDLVAAGLERIAVIMRAQLQAEARVHDLSVLQVQVLQSISKAKQEADTTVTALAKEFILTKATMSEVVNSLVAKGHCKKKKGLSDARSYTLTMTENGKRVVLVSGLYLEPVKKIIGRIALEEREALWRSLSSMIQKLEAATVR